MTSRSHVTVSSNVASFLTLAIALAGALLFSACSDSGLVEPVEEEAPMTMSLDLDGEDTPRGFKPYQEVAVTVQLLDGDGNPIAGEKVNWSPNDGEASASPEVSETDAEGYATTTWTLGAEAGKWSQSIKCVLASDETISQEVSVSMEKGSVAELDVEFYRDPVPTGARTSVMLSGGVDNAGNKLSKEELEANYRFRYVSADTTLLTVKEGEGGEGDLSATIYTTNSEIERRKDVAIKVDATPIGEEPVGGFEGKAHLTIHGKADGS